MGRSLGRPMARKSTSLAPVLCARAIASASTWDARTLLSRATRYVFMGSLWQRVELREKETTGVSGNRELFVGGADSHGAGAAGRTDDIGGILVASAIEVDAHAFEPRADALANGSCSFADAASEHQRVEAADRGDERADRFS